MSELLSELLSEQAIKFIKTLGGDGLNMVSLDFVERRMIPKLEKLEAENAMLQRDNERIQGYADSTDEVADTLRLEIARLKRILKSTECAECRKDMYDCDCEESE